MIENQQQQQPPPSTPQRTVLTLSPAGGRNDYSRLLPLPAKSPTSAATGLMMNPSGNGITSLATLSPELAHQKLQSPRRFTAPSTAVEEGEPFTMSQQPPLVSAFSSPYHQHQQPQPRQPRQPTETVLADGELSFFTRVTDISSSHSHISNYMDSFQVELPHNLRPANKACFNTPQRATTSGIKALEYISPATTPAKSEADDDNRNSTPAGIFDDFLGVGDALSDVSNSCVERNATTDGDVAGMLVPVRATAKVDPPSSAFYETNSTNTSVEALVPESNPCLSGSGEMDGSQPVHLLEQQQEYLLLQQEQELLQRQLQNEFFEEQQQYDLDEELALHRQLQYEFQVEQNSLSQLEYQHHQFDETIGTEDVTKQSTTFQTFGSTQAFAGDKGLERCGQNGTIQNEHWRTDPDPAVHMVPHEVNDVHRNLFHQAGCQNDISQGNNEMVDLGNNEGTSKSPNEPSPDHSDFEHSNRIQKRVIDRMMASPRAPVKPYLENHEQSTSGENETRNARNSSGSESDGISIEEDIKNQYEIEKELPADTVDSLKSTMHRAVDRLKTLANHISKSSNDSVPEAMNTSTESSSSTDADNISDFDLIDLAGELRNTKIESESQEQSANSHQAQYQRRNSATSFDTTGAPKPASLVQASVPPSNLRKPVPFNPFKTGPPLPAPSQKNSVSSNNKNEPHFFVPKPAADDRTRAVTPIVRMRNHGTGHMNTSLDDTKQDLSEEKIRAMKQKAWKDRMKVVKKNRENEKWKRHHSNKNNPKRTIDKQKQRQISRKTKSKVPKNSREQTFFVFAGHTYQVPTGIPTCKGDVIELLERFISTRCGNVDDTYDGDEDGDDESVDSNERSFYSEDYESCSDSYASTVDEQLEKAINDYAARSQAVNHVTVKAPKHMITIGIDDKQFIRQFIATLATEGFVLLSHVKNRTMALRRPSKNIAFLKRGEKTSLNSFVGPKLMWKKIRGVEGGEIDLFAIRSLEKATALELENYPYAMPGRSFFVRLSKEVDYVFEARDETEALQFVHGMRWLIARLAFNLIIGNVSVSCELLDVGEKMNIDDRYGIFPSSVKEETQWTMAMNEATTHLAQEVSKSIH